jgi:hypothetical protein
MLYLSEHVNMWRNRRTFLKWYSVTLLLAREGFLHVSVFHEQVCGEKCVMICTHFTHSVCKICAQGTVSWVYNFVSDYIIIANFFH